MPQSDAAKRTGFGVVQWAAVALFAVVGAGIIWKLLESISAGRMMAFLLELVFAILWLLIATAYVADLKQGRNKQDKSQRRPNKNGKPRPSGSRDQQLGSRG